MQDIEYASQIISIVSGHNGNVFNIQDLGRILFQPLIDGFLQFYYTLRHKEFYSVRTHFLSPKLTIGNFCKSLCFCKFQESFLNGFLGQSNIIDFCDRAIVRPESFLKLSENQIDGIIHTRIVSKQNLLSQQLYINHPMFIHFQWKFCRGFHFRFHYKFRLCHNYSPQRNSSIHGKSCSNDKSESENQSGKNSEISPIGKVIIRHQNI